MKDLIITKDLFKILESKESNEVKYIQIVQLINKTIKDWTWPAKDTSWGDISYKEGYNKAREEVISCWKDRFVLNSKEGSK